MISSILHIILAGLVFFSSTGITINSHYCLDELKEVALFVAAKSCCKSKSTQQVKCSNEHTPQINPKKCCQDRHSYVKADLDTDQVLKSFFKTYAIVVVPASWLKLVGSFQNITPPQQTKDELYYASFAPPPTKPIYLLVQSFRC